MDYPEGKDFIFSIFDDTDVSTLDYIRPIYDQLRALGIITTKSVWPLGYNGDSDYKGSHTLQDDAYARYMNELQDNGYEIAYHGPTMVSSTREETTRALDLFRNVLGRYPRCYAPHSQNRENLYWGRARFTIPFFRWLYTFIANENPGHYQGHLEASTYFWGDICLKHIDYVRNFTFTEMNLLNISDMLTYHDAAKPLVKSWFFTADADNVEEFNRLLCEANQERLQRERGVCLVSTHFGKGYVKEGRLHGDTTALLKKLSLRDGWFVPISTALDFIRSRQNKESLTVDQRFILEARWFLHTIRRRRGALQYDKTEIDYLAGMA